MLQNETTEKCEETENTKNYKKFKDLRRYYEDYAKEHNYSWYASSSGIYFSLNIHIRTKSRFLNGFDIIYSARSDSICLEITKFNADTKELRTIVRINNIMKINIETIDSYFPELQTGFDQKNSRISSKEGV
jgi:hypothetical protein